MSQSKRVYKALGHSGLCIETPFVENSNGQRFKKQLNRPYMATEISAATAMGCPVDPADNETAQGTDSKTKFKGRFRLILANENDTKTPEGDDRRNKDIFVYIGGNPQWLSWANGTGQFGPSGSYLKIDGTWGPFSLDYLQELAVSKGFNFSNLRAEANNEDVFFENIIKYEIQPNRLSANTSPVFLSEQTARDNNPLIRTDKGFYMRFHGKNYLKVIIPPGRKLTLTFDMTAEY